ncbi:MAG TPA: type VI secretion system tube protein TssD [Bacteroidales bacterium]|nr:type VI secretion system tube protein TssD [Bacteroidales bacterium]
MALTGTLEIGNKSYKILRCDYEFNQECDETGRPSGKTGGGKINISLDVPDDTDFTLHEWMRDINTTKDGKLTLIVNANNVEKKKTVSFKDAYCVKLIECFNFGNIEAKTSMMYMKISIVPGTVVFGPDDNCVIDDLIV